MDNVVILVLVCASIFVGWFQFQVIEKLVKLQTDNKILEARINSFEQLQDRLPADAASRLEYENQIIETLSNLQTENARLAERIKTLENQEERQSSVSAHVRLSKTTPLSGTERVMYDLEVSNIGGAYDFKNGQFIAPVAGVYMFRVTVCLFANRRWMDLNIVKNDYIIGRVFSVDNQYHTCGSEALSIHLDVGDKVWVQRAAGDSTSLNQDHGWNSFTGVLIHAD